MSQVIEFQRKENSRKFESTLRIEEKCHRCKGSLVVFKLTKDRDMVVCPNVDCACFANPVDKKSLGLPDKVIEG